MPLLETRLGTYELPHFHRWRERERDIRFERRPLIAPETPIATIGSCFASELADGMDRLGLCGAMHPAGLFYNTRSILQELRRMLTPDNAPPEPCPWKTTNGWVHPLKSHQEPFPTEEALRSWSAEVDRESEALFRNARVIVTTLGLIETWRCEESDTFYRVVPHPEAFSELPVAFHRLSVSEMVDDLLAIRTLIQSQTSASWVVTVSPIPLHATMTNMDVRVANTESKARIRAAVSELVDRCPDVHYFHSYELVTTAERESDFMLADGRHVHRHAVDYILHEFLRKFATPEVKLTAPDLSWLAGPSKTAAAPRSLTERVLRRVKRELLLRLGDA